MGRVPRDRGVRGGRRELVKEDVDVIGSLTFHRGSFLSATPDGMGGGCVWYCVDLGIHAKRMGALVVGALFGSAGWRNPRTRRENGRD